MTKRRMRRNGRDCPSSSSHPWLGWQKPSSSSLSPASSATCESTFSRSLGSNRRASERPSCKASSNVHNEPGLAGHTPHGWQYPTAGKPAHRPCTKEVSGQATRTTSAASSARWTCGLTAATSGCWRARARVLTGASRRASSSNQLREFSRRPCKQLQSGHRRQQADSQSRGVPCRCTKTD